MGKLGWRLLRKGTSKRKSDCPLSSNLGRIVIVICCAEKRKDSVLTFGAAKFRIVACFLNASVIAKFCINLLEKRKSYDILPL